MKRLILLSALLILMLILTACTGEQEIAYDVSTRDAATKDEINYDGILMDEADRLIGEYGVVSDKKLMAELAVTKDPNWTKRQGVVSAQLYDLDGDRINELIVVRLLGGELDKNPENIAVSVYYYTKDGVQSAGEITLPYGNDLTEKDVDLLLYEDKICYEGDFSASDSDASKMKYYILGYRDNTLSKEIMLETQIDAGKYFKWVETAWDADQKTLTDIYTREYGKKGTDVISGPYQDSEIPALDYFIDRGLPDTDDHFTSEQYPRFFYANGTELLCEMHQRKIPEEFQTMLSKLKDYTGLNHNRSTATDDEAVNWKQLYIEKLDEIEENDNTYDLIDIDADEIPEVIYSGVPNTGAQLILLKEDQAQIQKLTGGELFYEPNFGKILTHYYSMLEADVPMVDTVYQVQEGDVIKVFSGSRIKSGDTDGEIEYYLNDKYVSEEEYNRVLNAEFDSRYARAPMNHYSKEELIEIIEGY